MLGRMKWLLSVCALAGGVAIAAASCGPQEHFCPTTNPNQDDFTCHANNQPTGGTGGQDQGLCDGGHTIVCPNTDAQIVKCSLSECP